jgi:hypothetical protein
MRPEAGALHVLSTTRAKAKMFEFRVPLEDHIELPRNPDILFSLAVGILRDAAAAIGDRMATGSAVSEERSSGQSDDMWDSGDPSLRDSSPETVRFAATYFDAYLGSRLTKPSRTNFPYSARRLTTLLIVLAALGSSQEIRLVLTSLLKEDCRTSFMRS